MSSFKKYQIIRVIDDLLKKNQQGITNSDIYHALIENHYDFLDKEESLAKTYNLSENKKAYKRSLTVAWDLIDKELKSEGLSLCKTHPKMNKKEYIYSYPQGLKFNPCERILNKKRTNVKQAIYDILKNSSELLPSSWISSLELFPDEDPIHFQKIIQFDSTSTKNQELLPKVYDYIKNRKVISFKYHPFNKNPYRVQFIPYLLKEYNLRWFVCGRSLDKDKINYKHTVIALDRITSNIEEVSAEYIDNDINYEEYYKDVVGTTVIKENAPEDIVFQVNDEKAIEYISTKKIHRSQHEDGNTVRLRARINYELETKLFEFADRIVIESPISLREKLKERAKKALKNCE